MKQILTLLLALPLFAAEMSENLKGPWLNEKKNITIEIVEENGLFNGNIIALDDTVAAKTDNPDTMIGFSMFKGFLLKDDVLKEGKIIHIMNGKKYACEIEMISSDTLEIKAGTKLFKRTLYWTRVSNQ